MVHKHMADKLIEATNDCKDKPEAESKQIKELKAKLAELQASIKPSNRSGGSKGKSDSSQLYTKQASEENNGKCPLCDIYHYYTRSRGNQKGKEFATSLLSSCPKYSSAQVDKRAE